MTELWSSRRTGNLWLRRETRFRNEECSCSASGMRSPGNESRNDAGRPRNTRTYGSHFVHRPFHPIGHTLATASADYSIRLWDFGTRRRLATLQCTEQVSELTFSAMDRPSSVAPRTAPSGHGDSRSQQKDNLPSGSLVFPLPLFPKPVRTLIAPDRTSDGSRMHQSGYLSSQNNSFQLRERMLVSRSAVKSGPQDNCPGLRNGSVKLRNSLTGDLTTLKSLRWASGPPSHCRPTAGYW